MRSYYMWRISALFNPIFIRCDTWLYYNLLMHCISNNECEAIDIEMSVHFYKDNRGHDIRIK